VPSSPGPARRPLDAGVILTSLAIVLVTALAWAYLIHLDRQMSSAVEYDRMMAEMGMPVDRPWTLGDGVYAFAMWSVMMIGMMGPSAAPVLILYASAAARRAEGGPGLTAMFALGYVAVWTGFSACAAAAQAGLQRAALLTPAMAAASPRIGGAIVIAAGLYQLTPWKGACLAHCRSPLGFLMSQWRGGPIGALRMGASHGTYCLGCCWALMGVLFAVGVMNLTWVAALTAIVLIEKAGPAGTLAARTAGAAMIAGGAWLAVR